MALNLTIEYGLQNVIAGKGTRRDGTGRSLVIKVGKSKNVLTTIDTSASATAITANIIPIHKSLFQSYIFYIKSILFWLFLQKRIFVLPRAPTSSIPSQVIQPVDFSVLHV